MFIFSNGKQLRARNSKLIAFFCDGYNIGFIGLSSALILYLYPGEQLSHLLTWERNFIVSLGILFFWIILFSLFFLTVALSKVGIRIPIVIPFYVLFSTIMTEMLAREVGSFVVENVPPMNDEAIKGALINYVYILLFEIMYAIFVVPIPRIRKAIGRMRHPADASPSGRQPMVLPQHQNLSDISSDLLVPPLAEAQNPSSSNFEAQAAVSVAEQKIDVPVRILDKTFCPDDLMYIKSEDHYVRIVCATTSTLQRARLADVLKEVSAIRGMQVHRSFWVCFAGISEWYGIPEGGLMLIMKNGDRIPVSRSRRKKFQALLEHSSGQQAQ